MFHARICTAHVTLERAPALTSKLSEMASTVPATVTPMSTDVYFVLCLFVDGTDTLDAARPK